MKIQIKNGIIVSYSVFIINSIISFLYISWLVKTIGFSEYALYSLATTFISIFMLDFGLGSVVTTFISKYNVENQKKKINEFISTIEFIYFILSGIIFIVLLVIYFLLGDIYKGLTLQELEKFKRLYLIIGVYSVVSFPTVPFNGILIAYEKFIQIKICDLFQKIIIIVLVVISITLKNNLEILVLMNIIGGIIAILIKYLIIRNNILIQIKIKLINLKIIKEVFSFSIWVTIITLSQRCIFNLAPSILGMFSDTKAITIFASVNTLESIFYSFATTLNGIFLPMVARYMFNNQKKKYLS